MKTGRKLIACTLAVTMIAASACAAYADSSAGSGKSAGGKEEVVYIMTDAAGNVEDGEVVNIFGSGSITDYGDYSDVKILNTSDKIKQSGDKVTFSTDADRVYYQGTLSEVQLPWNISIKYYLDGREYSPAKLAGKSGSLKIKINITKNENCSGSFYDDYALQTSLQLDTEKCSNITAEGATAVNAGRARQLTYTTLPGKGLDAEITADVSDFEMEAISVNGVKLNLDADIDTSELESKLLQLTSAIEKLNTGADTLQENSGNILDALRSVQSQLSGSASAITDASDGASGVEGLTASSHNIKSAVDSIASGVSDLQKGLGYSSYKAAMSANDLDIDSLKAGNAQASEALTAQISTLQQALAQIEGVPGREAEAETLKAQISALQDTVKLLNADNAAISGMESYLGTVSQGAAELQSGTAELAEKYEMFDTGVSEAADKVNVLAGGVSRLSTGISTLTSKYSEFDEGLASYAEGTQELYTNTSGMDSQVQEKIDSILDSLSGGDDEAESFVSEKNTDVKSVQFVIKTSAIENADKADVKDTAEKDKSFLEKVKALFEK